MWGAKLVLVAAIACIMAEAAVAEAAVAEASVAQRNMRVLGGMTRYYVRTMDEQIEIKNIETDIEAQTVLIGGTQRVAVVVHGRESSAYSQFVTRVRDAFLNSDNTMAVVSVDWETVSRLSYTVASSAVRNVGEDLALFIGTLVDKDKLNQDYLHIVGFDLGAHVAGFASRTADSRAKKITGLDPAGEGWGQYSQGLDKSDADLVEVIHTDGVGNRAYGIGAPIGDLDFFPNGGTRQPGCANSDNLCHHNRAWDLFIATLQVPGHLRGTRCVDMVQVNNNRCTGEGGVIMGTGQLSKLESGIHRLVTGRVWPY